MIWLTWRQSRLKAASAAVVLVAFTLLLAATGPHLAGLYAGSPIGTCHGGPANCGGHADDSLQQLFGSSLTGASSVDGTGIYWLLYVLGTVIILVAPAVMGSFWGCRWWRASWRPEPTTWPGTRASLEAGGWRSSSP